MTIKSKNDRRQLFCFVHKQTDKGKIQIHLKTLQSSLKNIGKSRVTCRHFNVVWTERGGRTHGEYKEDTDGTRG